MKQLDEMTPEEIRLEIAERKGLKNVRELRLWDSGTNPLICDEINLIGHRIIPDWPASIAAAWELFDEIPGNKQINEFMDQDVFIWVVYAILVDCKYLVCEESITAPFAICRTWLAWKRSEDK